MSSHSTALALTALSLVESLILEFKEKGLIDEHEFAGVLDDVVSAHSEAAAEADDESAALHLEIVGLVRQVGSRGNSVRTVERLNRSGELKD